MGQVTPKIKRRDAIVSFVEEYTKENGFAPTIREIAEGVGLKSTSTVHEHLIKLDRDNLLVKESIKPRTIRVVQDDAVKVVEEDEAGEPQIIKWRGHTYKMECEK